jgi:HSP20 family protein
MGGFPFVFRGPWAEWMEAYKGNEKSEKNGDFTPEVDVFDSEELYTIHVSLPGANKEDVAVNWDADKSALTVAGVVTRPGDEAFLKDLAMDERKVGVFERVVKLGNERHPANVEQDAISAKFENGILIIEIPKAERDYVDVKKIDVQ